MKNQLLDQPGLWAVCRRRIRRLFAVQIIIIMMMMAGKQQRDSLGWWWRTYNDRRLHVYKNGSLKLTLLFLIVIIHYSSAVLNSKLFPEL